MYQRIGFCIVCHAHGVCVRDAKRVECPDDGSCKGSSKKLYNLALVSLVSKALCFHPVPFPVTRKPFLRVGRSQSASVAMCVPSITILNDGRGKRQIRERPRHEHSYRPLSRDAYDSFSETPPAGVVTARPSDPLRCPVPANYSRLADAYFAGQEKEKARAERLDMSKKPELVKKEGIPRNGEAPNKEINLVRDYEKLHRRRRRSSASSASSRSWKEMKELLKEVLRRRGIEDEVRRQVGSDRKHTNEEREQRRRSHERYGDSDLHGAYGKRRPRHRERTPLRGDREYFWKDTHHWSEA